MGADLFRKYVNSLVVVCYGSVVKHPFLVGLFIVLFSMYRLFPLLFSFLVSVSPVIVSTFVLLGTLLSFGNPNIPEIETKYKSDENDIRNLKLESKVTSDTEFVGRDGNFGFEETNRDGCLVDDDAELKFEEERLLDNEEVVLGSHYTPLKQSEDEHIVLESGDRLWEGSADPLNSDPNLLWKRVEGNNDDNEDDDDDDDDGDDEESDSGDSGSDMAESSSPDASMADIIPMLDELHPLLSEEQESREVVHRVEDVSEHSLGSSDSSSESDDDDGGNENHEDEEDKEVKHIDKEDEIRAAIRWTEYDQKNLMKLGTSELERNRRLENLILRRRARKIMRMQAEKNLIDLESVDIPWNIPTISTARNNPFDYDSNDNIPGSAPSVMLKRRNPFDLPYDSSEEKPDLVEDTFQQEFKVVQPKEPFFRRHESFNVGPSIFGASRSERQETKMRPYFVPERSFAEFQRQFSGLSDSKVSSVPDTESVSSVGDLENKDNIEEDEQILEEEVASEKDLQQASESNGRPYFLPEQVASDETRFPSFQRQLSEVSDSKVSSVPDTESVSSDHENKDHSEKDDQILEAELVSEKDFENAFESDRIPYFLPEQVVSDGTSFTSFQRQLSEVSDSKLSSTHDTESLSSAGDLDNKDLIDLSRQPDLITLEDHEHDSEMRERIFEHDHNMDPIQVLEDDERHVEIETDAIHLNLDDRDLHRSVSSLSSSDEVSEQIYNAKESGEVATYITETSDYFVERVNSVETSEIEITSLVVEDNQPKEPMYDLSPRSVTRNLSSSSILNDLHNDESLQHIDNHNQPSNSVADVEWNSIDSSLEIRDTKNQLPMILNNDEHMLAEDSISSSIPNKSLSVMDDVLLDTDASHQLEQLQIPSSFSDEISHEGINREEVISQSEDAELSFGTSWNKTSAENLEEIQGCEKLEKGQVASSYGEPQFSEAVDCETYDKPSEEEAISQLQREFPLLDTSAAEENPEELHVQTTSNNSDNLPMQEHENNVSLNINSVSSAEPDVMEVADIETKAPESPTYASDNFSIENNYVFDNIDDVDKIDEDLLVELDAVGDFSVSDLESTLNEMQEDPHAVEHDLETRPTVDEDSYSENELKEEPLVSEHDLETNRSVDDCSFSRELGTTLNGTTQETHGLDYNVKTNLSVDEDSNSKDLGSSLNEMTQEPRCLEHDIETKLSGDEGSYPKDLVSSLDEIKQDPRVLDDDLETKHSREEDSYSMNLGEMKQDAHASEHDHETKISLDEGGYSKDLGSTLDERKQDPHESDHNLVTNRSVDDDSYSTNSVSAFTEMKQDPHESDHDLEAKCVGDEDSISNDLGLALDEMKHDPDVSEHDLEIKQAGDENSISNDLGLALDEVKRDPDVSEHDPETNLSGDEDSYSNDLESTFNAIRQVPQVSEHRLETFYSVDENFYSKHVESTLNEMKQDQQATKQDLETDRSDDKDPYSIDSTETSKMDMEETKSGNEKETSNTEVAGASKDGSLKSITDASEVELPQQTKSPASLTYVTSATMVDHGSENESNSNNTEKE